MSHSIAKQPLVSIALPIYNAERFLDSTLSVIKNQSYTNLEIICVDDGSTDASRDIIRKYVGTDSRFKLLTQENSGAGVARNNGLAHATGEWILFLDADDIYSPKMIELMLKAAVAGDADLCICEVDKLDAGGTKPSPLCRFNKKLDKGVFQTSEVSQHLFQLTTPAPYNKMFKREFINEHALSFQALPNTNDLFFTSSALGLSKCIALVRQPLVCYRVGEGESIQDKLTKHPTIEKCLCTYKALKATREKLIGDKNFDNAAAISLDNFCVDNSYAVATRALGSVSVLDEVLTHYKKALLEEWCVDRSSLSFSTKVKFSLLTSSSSKEFEWVYGTIGNARQRDIGSALSIRLRSACMYIKIRCSKTINK